MAKHTTRAEVEHLPPLTDLNWCSWFAGFCDGEATFNINTYGSGTQFKITLREDDASILYEIQRKLGVGTVRFVNRGKNSKHNNGKDQCTYCVSGPSCKRIIEALNKNMKSKKNKDFLLWSKATEASISLGNKRTTTRRPMLLKYKKEIEDGRKFVRFRK